ncbi:hypothetical protein GCM10010298_61790 [Streptomyces microflavus]|nr:hypothetical protein GCM10010298_61790 [Streptomyces microflavus]
MTAQTTAKYPSQGRNGRAQASDRRASRATDAPTVNPAGADSSSRTSTTCSVMDPSIPRWTGFPTPRAYTFMSIERLTRPGVRHNDRARLTTQ